MGYRGLQGVRRDYKGLEGVQWVTGSDMGIQKLREGYKGL